MFNMGKVLYFFFINHAFGMLFGIAVFFLYNEWKKEQNGNEIKWTCKTSVYRVPVSVPPETNENTFEWKIKLWFIFLLIASTNFPLFSNGYVSILEAEVFFYFCMMMKAKCTCLCVCVCASLDSCIYYIAKEFVLDK